METIQEQYYVKKSEYLALFDESYILEQILDHHRKGNQIMVNRYLDFALERKKENKNVSNTKSN